MRTSTLGFLLVFFALMIGVFASAQNSMVSASPDPLANIQNGYLQVIKTVSYPSDEPISTGFHLNLYFYRNDQGQFDIIYESMGQIYLRIGGVEQSYERLRNGYQKQVDIYNPFEQEGILHAIFQEKSIKVNALFENLPEKYKDKIVANSDNSTVIWKLDGDGFPAFFQRQLLLNQQNFVVTESLKEKLLNTFDRKSFDDLFLDFLNKVNKPHSFNIKDQVYIQSNLTLFNSAGDQMKVKDQSLRLIIFLPNEMGYTTELIAFLDRLQSDYPKLGVRCITTDEVMSKSASAFTQMVNSGAVEALKESHLYDTELRFTLVGNKRLILNQWIGFYPEQQFRIHKSISANLEK
jgi:hypothetical protein